MNESCMLWNFVDVGYVWGPSILLTGGLCGGLFRVGFFWGRSEQTLDTGGPHPIHPNISRPLCFPRKFPPKYTTNKNDLTTKICLEETMVCNLLCSCHSVSSSMRSLLFRFWTDSAIILLLWPLHCDSSTCLLGRVSEVILKLRGSCHLRVALKHLQSLCFRFQLP